MTTSLLCHGRKFGVDLIDAAQQAYMGGLIEEDDHWDVVDENGDVVPVFAEDPWDEFETFVDQILRDDEARTCIGARTRNDIIIWFGQQQATL